MTFRQGCETKYTQKEESKENSENHTNTLKDLIHVKIAAQRTSL